MKQGKVKVKQETDNKECKHDKHPGAQCKIDIGGSRTRGRDLDYQLKRTKVKVESTIEDKVYPANNQWILEEGRRKRGAYLHFGEVRGENKILKMNLEESTLATARNMISKISSD